ncbi:IPO11 protein, partial [Polypterus senegalus]
MDLNSADNLVLQALSHATSQDTAVLKPAEEQLKQWETQPGFYSVLLLCLLPPKSGSSTGGGGPFYYDPDAPQVLPLNQLPGLSEVSGEHLEAPGVVEVLPSRIVLAPPGGGHVLP